MNEKYFVLYRRDVRTEKTKEYGERRLYDKCKFFCGWEEAKDFASENFPSLLGNKNLFSEAKEEKKYLAVVRHGGKYKHHDYGGDCDYLETYDVLRCKKSELEKTLEEMSTEEHAEKVFAGIEEKLF